MLDTFLPGMKAVGKGHVVFLSSMAGIMGLKNLVPYCASKFAVRGNVHTSSYVNDKNKMTKLKLFLKCFVTGLAEAVFDECRESGHPNLNFTSIFPYMVDTGLCKKPIIRYVFFILTQFFFFLEIINFVRNNSFPSLLPLVTPESTAKEIISAVRKNVLEQSIPSPLLLINNVFR